MQECLDRISASKKKPVKKAVPVEEPSSDDDTADRISPSAMQLKKRPAKKTVQEEEQLSNDGSLASSPPNLEKFIFLKPRSHSAGMAPVHPGEGQPVYRDEPGHFS